MKKDEAEKNLGGLESESPRPALEGCPSAPLNSKDLAERLFNYGDSVGWGQSRTMMAQLEFVNIINTWLIDLRLHEYKWINTYGDVPRFECVYCGDIQQSGHASNLSAEDHPQWEVRSGGASKRVTYR